MTSTRTSAGRLPISAARRTGRQLSRWRWVVPSLAVVTITATACSSSGGSTSAPASSSSSSPSSSSSSAGSLLGTADTKIGTVLVDSKNATVYQFANDHDGMSTCTGQCATVWPPVVAPDTLPSSLQGVTGQLGSTTRDDGSKQLTVAGHPVYTFTGDSGPGQTNGQGIVLNGGLWTAVLPSGGAVPTGMSSSPAPAPAPTY